LAVDQDGEIACSGVGGHGNVKNLFGLPHD
jgi:hypothetical protein